MKCESDKDLGKEKTDLRIRKWNGKCGEQDGYGGKESMREEGLS